MDREAMNPDKHAASLNGKDLPHLAWSETAHKDLVDAAWRELAKRREILDESPTMAEYAANRARLAPAEICEPTERAAPRDWRALGPDGQPWASGAFWRCSGCSAELPPAEYLPGTGDRCAACVGEEKAKVIRARVEHELAPQDGREWQPPRKPAEEPEEDARCSLCGRVGDDDPCVGCMARAEAEKDAAYWEGIDKSNLAPTPAIETIASGPYAGFKVANSKSDPARAAIYAVARPEPKADDTPEVLR
jgi:hypothetical protein